MNKKTKNKSEKVCSEITREEAIKKMGKYAALTAFGTFMILNPKIAQAQSASPNPGDGSNSGGGSNLGDDNPPPPAGWDD
jgi:hypothetical protein